MDSMFSREDTSFPKLAAEDVKEESKNVAIKCESKKERRLSRGDDEKVRDKRRSRSPEYSRQRSRSREHQHIDRHHARDWPRREYHEYHNDYRGRHNTYRNDRSYRGSDNNRRFHQSDRSRRRSRSPPPYIRQISRIVKEPGFKDQAKQQQTLEQAKIKNFEDKSVKLKQQVEKRKQLWQQGNKEKKVADHWGAMLATCSDDQQAKRLKKLMGLKTNGEEEHDQDLGGEAPSGSSESETKTSGQSALGDLARRQQERLFNDLNVQYEMGRMSTHMHRGVGLGFASQMHEYAAQIDQSSEVALASSSRPPNLEKKVEK